MCFGMDNLMAYMLSRARFREEIKESVDDEEELDLFKTTAILERVGSFLAFKKGDYEEDWLVIGKFLSKLTKNPSWKREEAQRIRKKAHKYFLKGVYLWKHPKKRMETLLQVVCKKEDQRKLVSKYHESP